ncbi:MAG: chromosome segregation protein SMC [Deltaproteobacteria bacterium]|nr:chromosome segregation protein SMC [Deltaproteobacteria bacterium]
MRIKRLEIQGFKSFADRTIIDFQQGVTGIVGPNGCGKSNVVDAIRWVMGEMSAKHLRGREMQDVIFSGTDRRAPSSFAEVNLILSNEEGKAPIAFNHYTEISVTRRLYRDGESEYLLNKIQCRLRDIYDLFLGTGVGTKAYSVVEQGQIGQVIHAKPEDRRKIIEEAAGISKFKARREAALRKMEAAEGNLTRLNDIVQELSRQLSSLDRQARKAERYRELKEELRKKELHLVSLEFLDLNLNMNLQESESGKLSQDEASMAAQLSNFETELESLKFILSEEERELSILQEKLYENNNSISLHEQGLQFKTREIKNWEERHTQLSLEIAGLSEKNIQYENELSQVNEARAIVDLRVAQAEEGLGVYEEQVLQQGLKQEEIARKIEGLQRQVLSLVGQISQAASRKESFERQKLDLAQRLEQSQADYSQNQECLAGFREKLLLLEGSLEQFNQLKLDLLEQSQSTQQALDKAKQGVALLQNQSQSLKDELSHKKSRLLSLEEIQKKFEGYKEGVRRVLLRKSENPDELSEVYGTVADILETKPEYQTALGAVLGEKLEYVVVKSQAAGLEALEYLKSEVAGRSSFVPMCVSGQPQGDWVNEEIYENHEGVLGPLKDFVQVREDYAPVGDYLFRDVLLVRNLGAAIQMWNGSTQRKTTLVTLEGEVVDAYGVVSGGSEQNESLVLLKRRREIKDLRDSVWGLEVKLRLKEEELRQESEWVQILQKWLEGLKREAHIEDLKILDSEKDFGHLRFEVHRLEQAQTRLERERGELCERENQMNADLVLLSENLFLFEEEKSQKERELLKEKEQFQIEQKQWESRKQDLTLRTLEAQNVQEKKIQVDKEISRLVEAKRAALLRMEACERLIQSGTEEAQKLGQEIESSKVLLQELIFEVRGLSEKQVLLKEAFEGHQSQMREKEIQLKQIRLDHEQTQSVFNKGLLQLTEIRSRLQFLKEQIFERYHTDIVTIAPQYQGQLIENPEAFEQQVLQLKEKLSKMGEVNLSAISEYEEIKQRYDFLTAQAEDLKKSLESLHHTIQKINRSTKRRFVDTFEAINNRFEELFPKLFHGGKAKLLLTDENNILETGVEIVAQPPGKKLQSISLLSGGEKALTAVSLIFSIFLFKPSPFCILDEVDAPLDDANVDRFNALVKQMTERSQFILITHSKRTMELADVLYGITMEEAGVSKTVSVRLNEKAA